MTTKHNKIDGFPLFVDRDLEHVFNLVWQMAMEHPAWARSIRSNGLIGANKQFLAIISEKSHELGWCDDPDCEHDE